MIDTGVVIAWDQVRALADTIARLPRAASFAAGIVRPVRAGDEDCFRAFLWAAAICHSTQGGLTGVRGRVEVHGWDYLLEAFSTVAEIDATALTPAAMQQVTGTALRDLLLRPFDEAAISLTDLDRRAEILVESAKSLEQIFGGSVTTLLDLSGHCVGGPQGAYAQLETLAGFGDDAQSKKSSAFLMAVHFSGRWRAADQELVKPMIDYHRMRLLLRTGCIVPPGEELREALRTRSPVEGEVANAIREAAMIICTAIPQLAQLDVFDFDVLLWGLARSWCRNRPLCVHATPERDTFSRMTGLPNEPPCVLAAVCVGAANSEVRGFWEPEVETEDY